MLISVNINDLRIIILEKRKQVSFVTDFYVFSQALNRLCDKLSLDLLFQ